LVLRVFRLLSLALGLAALLHANGACLCGHARAAAPPAAAPAAAPHCAQHEGAAGVPRSAPASHVPCPHCGGHALVPDVGLAAAFVPAAPMGADLALGAAGLRLPLVPAALVLARSAARAHAPPHGGALSVVLRI
jgi:hypothetical protein